LDYSIDNTSDSLRFTRNDFYAYFIFSQRDIEIKEIKDYKAFYFIYSLVNHLNYR